ncbi:MAG: cation:proton antiporter [Proteobacteria bacterium]|nr:cation:proton antiporter [Pseudomonadota bacterium]
MEKQKNRGQDGAGVANIKINQEPGYKYISRYRSIDRDPISDIFRKINRKYQKAARNEDEFHNEYWLTKNLAFTGEVWLGHLRYGTHGKNSIENCHPILRQNNWRSRSLALAGNFNMTNVDQLVQILIDLGQHPKEKSDTVTVLEKIGHFMDEENQAIFDKYKDKYSNNEIAELIANELDLAEVLRRSCRDFDGGYVMAGLAAIIIALGARYLTVFSVIRVLSFGRQFNRKAVLILTWGGLRGGISVALALSLPPTSEREILLAATYAVVIFSIIVQGLTMARVVRRYEGA